MNGYEPQHHVQGARTDAVDLPRGINFETAAFQRNGADLILVGENGTTVFIRDFFGVATPPMLRAHDGETIAGNLPRILVNLSGRAVSVLMSGNRERA